MKTFDDLCNNISNDIHFAFSRYGDGEWNAMFGKAGANCDGHVYFDDLGARLRDVVQSAPDYYLGMQSLAMKLAGGRINIFRDNIEGDMEWIDADIMHRASIDGVFDRFFDSLGGKKVFFIGPDRLSTIRSCINPVDYRSQEVPLVNCWQMNIEDIKAFASVHDDWVFLFCASMATNVWIDELYNINSNNTYIDCGSVFDPYCGYHTRTYHKKLAIGSQS